MFHLGRCAVEIEIAVTDLRTGGPEHDIFLTDKGNPLCPPPEFTIFGIDQFAADGAAVELIAVCGVIGGLVHHQKSELGLAAIERIHAVMFRHLAIL